MILVDTHVILWLAQNPGEISAAADRAIRLERQQGRVAISGRSLWEIAYLARYNKILLDRPILDFLNEVERQFHVLPLTASIAEQSIRFSSRYPSDPSDQVIGATAVVHAIPLITRDAAIRASGEVQCIW